MKRNELVNKLAAHAPATAWLAGRYGSPNSDLRMALAAAVIAKAHTGKVENLRWKPAKRAA